MVITSKRGNLDNVVTYEHICDFTADMADIDPHYITLGSVCTVINGEGGLELYIADSEKQWHPIMAGGDESGNNDEEQGGGSSSGEGPFGLREILRFSGNDVAVMNSTTIAINYQGNESQNYQLCLNIKAIGIFDSNNSVPVVLSNTENVSVNSDYGAVYLTSKVGSIGATFKNNNSIMLTVALIGVGFSAVNYAHYTVVFYGE